MKTKTRVSQAKRGLCLSGAALINKRAAVDCGDPRPRLSHRLLGLEVALSSGSVWISRLLAGTHDREYSPVSRMIDIVSTTPSFKIHTDFEV